LNLPKDTNIFLINKQALEQRVENEPAVKEVRLYRRLPNTLIVRVIERKPELILETSKALYEVDSEGVPYRIAKKVDSSLPLITCGMVGSIRLGQQLRTPEFLIARNCLLLAKNKKMFNVAKLSVDQSQELCLNVRDGYQVKLGRPEQLSEKLDIAAQAVAQIPEFRERGEYVDVSCPEAPAIKLTQ
jgi:cell division protein FtsQ